MSLIHSKGFNYVKNLIIGCGASVVLIGALFKIQSWPGASEMLTAGLLTEAGLFLMLGLLPPHTDYYWEKLYPGLDTHGGTLEHPGANGSAGPMGTPLNGDIVEKQLGGMLSELQVMAKSMSSLKALQEVDFASTGEQVKKMSDFYGHLNEAMANISESIDDTKTYRSNLATLNTSLGNINGSMNQLDGVFSKQAVSMSSFSNSMGEALNSLADSVNDTKQYKDQLSALNKNLGSLNNVYGSMLSAMSNIGK
jgi:ABC-type transporter Mla subunit MlaD